MMDETRQAIVSSRGERNPKCSSYTTTVSRIPQFRGVAGLSPVIRSVPFVAKNDVSEAVVCASAWSSSFPSVRASEACVSEVFRHDDRSRARNGWTEAIERGGRAQVAVLTTTAAALFVCPGGVAKRDCLPVASSQSASQPTTQ